MKPFTPRLGPARQSVLMPLWTAPALLLSSLSIAFECVLASASRGVARDVTSLSSWARRSGISMHGSMRWKEHSPGDWGVVLSEPVAKGTVVLKIPRSMVLDARVIREGVSEATRRRAVTALGKFAAHEENFWIVWRLYELRRDPGGAFDPWLDAMPVEFAAFTEAEVDCLPYYSRYAARYQDEKFEAFCRAAKAMESGVFDSSSDGDDAVSQFLWAFRAVNSRFWKTTPKKEHADIIKSTSELVPIGDMFNHRDPPNCQMIPEDGDFVTFAYNCDSESGADADDIDLFITYGQPANPHRFLVVFGFPPCVEYMPKLWCHLDYSSTNPHASKFDEMVFDSQTGAVSATVWDAVLWELSEPSSLEEYNQTRDEWIVQYRGILEEVLMNHIEKQLTELRDCSEEIDRLDKESPNFDIIRRQNDFLTEVFAKVKDNCDNWKSTS